MRSVHYIFLLLLLTTKNTFAQGPRADSLLQALSSSPNDTSRVNTLNELVREYRDYDLDTSMTISMEALRLSLKTNFLPGIARSCVNVGVIYSREGSFTEAIDFFGKSMVAWKLLYPPDGGIHAAPALGNLGLVYADMGNSHLALEYFFKLLAIAEKTNDRQLLTNNYGNMGLVYYDKGDYPAALKYYLKCLHLSEETVRTGTKNQAFGAKKRIALMKGNLGNLYFKTGIYDTARIYYLESLHMREELNMQFQIATVLSNLGVLCIDEAKRKKDNKIARDTLQERANYYFIRSLEIEREIGDSFSIASCLSNLGNLNAERKEYAKADNFFKEGLLIAKKIGATPYIRSNYEGMAYRDSMMGNYKSSLINYQFFIQYNDSLNNEDNTKKMVQTEMQYEFDKKEAATKLEQEKKEAVAQAEKRRQRIILFAISGFGLLILVFAIFAYRSFLQKRKANIEISHQKELIEEKQKEILDSIYYARRIQRSLLTSERYIQKHLKRLMS